MRDSEEPTMSTHATERPELRTILAAASLLGAVACGGLLLAGCGSSAKVESRSTVGQELQDLETARSKGLLTEDEYQKQREAILKRK
jgi:hypothetical protein